MGQSFSMDHNMYRHEIKTVNRSGWPIHIPLMAQRTRRIASFTRKIPYTEYIEKWRSLQTGKVFFLIISERDGKILRMRGVSEKELRNG